MGRPSPGVRELEFNVIYCGDARDVLFTHIPEASVDLVYMDPPFFSGQIYEELWKDGYERRSFEDRWKGGIENYVAWMEPKVQEIHRVLKATGSFYLHCDWHAIHVLRVLCDKVFTATNFRSGITWQRTSPHNDPSNYGDIADFLLYYTKSNKFTWHKQYIPYSKQYLEDFYRFTDKKGRRYRLDNLASPHPRPNLTYEYKGFEPPAYGWRHDLDRMELLDSQGRLEFPKKKDGRIQLRRYLDEMPGVVLQNIWTDIPPIHSHAKERLGYPTQKPEALLQRIIQSSSNKGDLVLDPMCGCGTAIAVAHRLERRWIGVDISPSACKLMGRRLKALRSEAVGPDGKKKMVLKIGPTNVKILGLPQSSLDLSKIPPFEFQNWVCQKLHARVSTKKIGDLGIDGTMFDGAPLQVKQSEHVGRPVVDSFETALQRVKMKRGVIVAFSFTKGAFEECARAKNELGLEIELKTVKQILDEEGGEDPADSAEE